MAWSDARGTPVNADAGAPGPAPALLKGPPPDIAERLQEAAASGDWREVEKVNNEWRARLLSE